MGDHSFVYKLWLSKSLPWIDDVAFYFSTFICKNFVSLIAAPSIECLKENSSNLYFSIGDEIKY